MITTNPCPLCEAREAGKPTEGLKHRATTPVPEVAQLEEWMSDAGCQATDGCWVEPDGKCEHGHSSWMLHMGLI